jgi:hypothetical protein
MTAQQSSPPSRPRRDTDTASVGEVIDLVRNYALQETVGPLKGAGRWLAMGAAGAALMGLGASIFVLGILRLVQTEWVRSSTGLLSWVAYLIAFLVAVGLLALALSRINRDHLNKEPN